MLSGPEGILFILSNVQIPGVQIENIPPVSACDPNAYRIGRSYARLGYPQYFHINVCRNAQKWRELQFQAYPGELMGPLLFGLAFFSPVVASFCALVFYRRHCSAYRNPERRISVFIYLLALLVCAIIAYLIGMRYGVRWACSSPSGGNLCFLTGLFVVGPFAAALAIFFVSASILLLPGSEKGTTWKISSVFFKLWRGHYSLGRSFWGFFILGTCIIWIVSFFGRFLFLLYPPTLLIFRLVSLGYLIIAAVGVWRSANVVAKNEQHPKTYADSVKIIAAKIVVILVILFFAIGGQIDLALHSLYTHAH